MVLRSQKQVLGYGTGMERVWNGVYGVERNGHQTENLHDSELKRQAPRHDPPFAPHDHCPVKRHSLNKFATLQQPRGFWHESRVCMGHIHEYNINSYHRRISNKETQVTILITAVPIIVVILIVLMIIHILLVKILIIAMLNTSNSHKNRSSRCSSNNNNDDNSNKHNR